MKEDKSTGRHIDAEKQRKAPVPVSDKSSKYFCPMHCEGDKMYDAPGSCPVCGMFLVSTEKTDTNTKESKSASCCSTTNKPEAIKSPNNNNAQKYFCPMHCEGDKMYDAPGSCPVCGMFLVSTEKTDTNTKESKSASCCSSNKPESTEPQSNKDGDYYCPMHCEGDKMYDAPGSCPVCGMFLISTDKADTNTKESKSASCCSSAVQQTKSPKPRTNKAGKYYCPMHCEGDKVYDHAGNCPVCGMNLEKIPDMRASTQYTCPMHPEIVEDGPGSCPICGMDLVPITPDDDNKTYVDLLRKFWVALGFTIPIFILAMGEMIPGDPIGKIIPTHINGWIQLALTVPVVFYATWMFFERAWRSFKTWKLNMFSLIGLGATAAFIYSLVGLIFPQLFPAEFRGHHGNVGLYFESVCVILTLVLLGQVMEAKAHSKTNSAIKELIKLAPSEATLVENGSERKIAVESIVIGNVLRVKPGDKIPVDGEIVEGNATVDESMISGEPVPVDKQVGDKVSSGTINGNRTFLMKAERVGDETLLSQIINMVNDASRSKAPIQKLTDRVSAIFVPIVIVISLLTFAAWMIWGPEPRMIFGFANLLAVLIVACPCALGLATPMSVMVGVGKGAKNGILIKNAEALEKLNKVNVLVTDKTGTLTEGKPTVNEVFGIAAFDTDQVLQMAAALNQNSTHPLAEAIVKKAKEQQLKLDKVEDFENISGKGVSGTIGGKHVLLGNEKLLIDQHISISEEIRGQVEAQQATGKTVSYLAIDKDVAGFITISDKIKATAKVAIQQLIAHGVDVVMITGDNAKTANAVADELGIKHFLSQALPEDKLQEIKKMQTQGQIVAMAGDGINDAPALAQADIGIAMGTGTDVAIESAQVTLLKGDLTGIVKAKILSEKLTRNIKENLTFAFLYNVLGIPLAAGVLYPVFGLLLSPMIAAAAMSFSSVSVILNSLRLNAARIDR
ncbi:copper-transporting P-type ATPase [Sphingobacterium spiritivorum]|uniref:copper-transporting P-type ATPase n=1 Tax=Sphingobacterium spiritivorum TaxID=258 RepID=UPI003DA630FB